MKKWLFSASTDGVNIDFQTVLEANTEPDFWYCYDLAAAHGCEFWAVDEITD